MRCLRYLPLPSLLWILLASPAAQATPWKEDPAFFTDSPPGSPSSKVDAADLDGDGLIDLVFANTAGFNKGDPNGSDLRQQAFRNNGAGMDDISDSVFGMGKTYNGRVVKLRDVDDDDDIDIILGTTWFSQSNLFLNDGNGVFTDATANLPLLAAQVGDLEVGDVDDDGDLDIVLSNWGEDPVLDGEADGPDAGGRTLLWEQAGQPAGFGSEGSAMFTDITASNMPSLELRWSWDVEFVDVDNDYALDIVAACKDCPQGSVFLFVNDGLGSFSQVSLDNAQGDGALDVEAINLDGDAFLDLITLHDAQGGRNRVLRNNGGNGFVVDQMIWPQTENPSAFDFMGAFYDYDSDNDPDLVLGAIQNIVKYPDRLMDNQVGIFKQWGEANVPKFQALEHVPNPANASGGTYAIVLADFNGDFKLDVAMAQNENAFTKKVFLATDEVAPDSSAPTFVNWQSFPPMVDYPGDIILHARVHDNKSPLMLHDFDQTNNKQGFPYIESWDYEPVDPDNDPGEKTEPGQWYGEYLWRIRYEITMAPEFWYRLCAIDAAGNKRCTPVEGPIFCANCGSDDTTSSTSGAPDSETVTPDNTTFDNTTSSFTDSESNTDTASETVMSSSDQPTDTQTADNTTSTGLSVSETDTAFELDDDGCGCDSSDNGARGLLASLALLGLLGVRRRRR